MGCKIWWEERRIEDYNQDKRSYDSKNGTINMSWARITDSRLNSHVTLPGMQAPEKEAHISMRISIFNNITKRFYVEDRRKGIQAPNMDNDQTLGLKSFKKRQ